jgi:hypothetical protein
MAPLNWRWLYCEQTWKQGKARHTVSEDGIYVDAEGIYKEAQGISSCLKGHDRLQHYAHYLPHGHPVLQLWGGGRREGPSKGPSTRVRIRIQFHAQFHASQIRVQFFIYAFQWYVYTFQQKQIKNELAGHLWQQIAHQIVCRFACKIAHVDGPWVIFRGRHVSRIKVLMIDLNITLLGSIPVALPTSDTYTIPTLQQAWIPFTHMLFLDLLLLL